MKRRVALGIDTSNYTTSVSIISEGGEIIANIKELLPVPPGQCGLRQSDALFNHTKNLPEIMSSLRAELVECEIIAVGVSEKPRNIEGSYMPVFLAGLSVAEAVSASLGVPLYKFSHQCGHIRAAIHSAGREDLLRESFAALHLSGGTTELLRVFPDANGFKTEIIGGTLDLNAGQVVDRVGVLLGTPFPAGPHLEALALEYSGKPHRRPISSRGMYLNLSGGENMADKLYRESGDKSAVAMFVFDYIGRAIVKICKDMYDTFGRTTIVAAGGVMCNSVVKRVMSSELDVVFAEPRLSSDNAVGVGLLALDAHRKLQSN